MKFKIYLYLQNFSKISILGAKISLKIIFALNFKPAALFLGTQIIHIDKLTILAPNIDILPESNSSYLSKFINCI